MPRVRVSPRRRRAHRSCLVGWEHDRLLVLGVAGAADQPRATGLCGPVKSPSVSGNPRHATRGRASATRAAPRPINHHPNNPLSSAWSTWPSTSSWTRGFAGPQACPPGVWVADPFWAGNQQEARMSASGVSTPGAPAAAATAAGVTAKSVSPARRFRTARRPCRPRTRPAS
jgi:hypothetical protein